MEASLHMRCNIGFVQENPLWHMPSLSFVGLPSRSFSAIVENAAKNRAFRVKVTDKKKKGIEAVLGEDEEEEEEEEEEKGNLEAGELSCIMKFGGSSLASAERIREIAQLILSFPEENPIIVLSAMGKTTNNLLLVIPFFFSCFFFLLFMN